MPSTRAMKTALTMALTMADPERRYVEFRAEGDTLSGVVMPYGTEARFGSFRERFEPGSLRFEDVIVNLQHDRGKPVARTGAGLSLEDTPTALRASIALPDTVYGREARELVSARILRGFSVEFRAEEERWEQRTRIVTRAALTGIGIVDRAAYSDAQIEARFQAVPIVYTKRYWY